MEVRTHEDIKVQKHTGKPMKTASCVSWGEEEEGISGHPIPAPRTPMGTPGQPQGEAPEHCTQRSRGSTAPGQAVGTAVCVPLV